MNELNEYIKKTKPLILKRIKKICRELPSKDASEKIYEYTSRGKLLRGVLLCMSAGAFGRDIDDEVLDAAAAVELAQSALLMHDDVMDRDELRRGKPSMHKIYESECGDSRMGESMALCLGDAVIFHLFGYLNKDLVRIFSKELAKTAFGQMSDVSSAGRELSQEEILSVIKNKTAGYTFYLPFAAGAKLASWVSASLINLSVYMGEIFQIRDDELNYTDSAGKSFGGDIRENKKTLCRAFLIEEYPYVKDWYGDENRIKDVAELYNSSQAKKRIAAYMDELYEKSKEIISNRPNAGNLYGSETGIKDAAELYESQKSRQRLADYLNNSQSASSNKIWYELLDYLMYRKF